MTAPNLTELGRLTGISHPTMRSWWNQGLLGNDPNRLSTADVDREVRARLANNASSPKTSPPPRLSTSGKRLGRPPKPRPDPEPAPPPAPSAEPLNPARALTDAELIEIGRRELHAARLAEQKAAMATLAKAKAALELAEVHRKLVTVDSARDALRQACGEFVKALLSLRDSDCIRPDLRDAFGLECAAVAEEVEREVGAIRIERAEIDAEAVAIVEEVED